MNCRQQLGLIICKQHVQSYILKAISVKHHPHITFSMKAARREIQTYSSTHHIKSNKTSKVKNKDILIKLDTSTMSDKITKRSGDTVHGGTDNPKNRTSKFLSGCQCPQTSRISYTDLPKINFPVL